jgi:hypothetical protein
MTNDTLAQSGIELMQADWSIGQGSASIDLPLNDIHQYHAAVFALHQLPETAWTAYTPLELRISGRKTAIHFCSTCSSFAGGTIWDGSALLTKVAA